MSRLGSPSDLALLSGVVPLAAGGRARGTSRRWLAARLGVAASFVAVAGILLSPSAPGQAQQAPALQSLGLPLEHDGRVKLAAFSPDSKVVLTLDEHGVCWLWDTASQALIGGSIQGPHRITGLNFDRRGKTVVGPGSPYAPVRAAGFTPDGKSLIVVSSHLQRWNPVTAQPRGKPVPLEGPLGPVAVISPTGKAVLVTTAAKPAPAARALQIPPTARLLSASTGKPLGRQLALGQFDPKEQATAAAFSPDGRTVLVVYPQKAAQRWDVATGKRLRPDLEHPGKRIDAVRFSADGKAVLTVGRGEGQVWDAQTAKPLGQPLWGKFRGTDLSLSPDGRRVVSVAEDGYHEVWEVATGKRLVRVNLPGRVGASAFGPDGRLVLTAGLAVGLWDADTGRLVAMAPPLQTGAVQAAFSPGGDLALVVEGKRVHLWKVPAPP